LCLPGREWLEASQVYLDLGFAPENIYGVERDADVRQEFEKNGQALGCQTYFGNLESFVKSSPESFDVVSLDFVGPVSKNAIEIIKTINTNKEFLILTNFMGKRENSGQKPLREYMGLTDFYQDSRKEDVRNDILYYIEERADKIQKSKNNQRKLSEIRDSGLFLMVQKLFIRTNPHLKKHIEPLLEKVEIGMKQKNSDYEPSRESLWNVFTYQTYRLIQEFSDIIDEIIGTKGSSLVLKDIFLKSALSYPDLISYSGYKYKGGENNKGSLFISDFMKFKIPSDLSRELRYTTQFILTAMKLILSNEQFIFRVESEKKQKIVKITDNDGEKNFAEISLKRLMRDMDRYHEHIGTDQTEELSIFAQEEDIREVLRI